MVMKKYSVAPFAGAWIEMQPLNWTDSIKEVAPFAGAWIEIIITIIRMICFLRRSLRGSVD